MMTEDERIQAINSLDLELETLAQRILRLTDDPADADALQKSCGLVNGASLTLLRQRDRILRPPEALYPERSG